MTIEFLVTALIVCLAPGIGMMYTLSTALGGGTRRGLLAALGCTIVTGIHLLSAMAGLAAILHASAVAFQTVKFAGVAYLLWMAWTTLHGRGTLDVRPDVRAPGQSAITIVWRGILLNLLNPKLPIFFVAFLPQFIPVDADTPTALIAELGMGFVGMTGLVMAGYALAAGSVRVRVTGSATAMRWLRRAFAASFAALAARLAVERA